MLKGARLIGLGGQGRVYATPNEFVAQKWNHIGLSNTTFTGEVSIFLRERNLLFIPREKAGRFSNSSSLWQKICHWNNFGELNDFFPLFQAYNEGYTLDQLNRTSLKTPTYFGSTVYQDARNVYVIHDMQRIKGNDLIDEAKIDNFEYKSKLMLKLLKEINKMEEVGVIHKDLSLDQCILQGEDLYIVDWGHAEIKNRQYPRGLEKLKELAGENTWGKSDYMSPEQAQGKEVTHASMLFSAGMCAYRLYVNKLPLFYFGEYNDEVKERYLKELEDAGVEPKIISGIESVIEPDPKKRDARKFLNILTS